jgi:quinolinate synthase
MTMSEVRDRALRALPAAEWAAIEPLVAEIEELKRRRNAVVLAHNYMTPDIFHTVADRRGDSLALAQEGARTDADVIVLAGVHFMAETAKILAPDKTVLIPDVRAGCSLASSITAADVITLRAKHPGVPVVTYVNTTAEVKAVSDICCTSANVVRVVESLGAPKVLLLPDRFLAANVAQQTGVEIVTWETGACEVHERFTGEQMRDLRAQYGPDLAIVAHPECPTDVTDEADFVGSTTAMGNWIARHASNEHGSQRRVALITECSMADNLAADLPEVEWVRACNLCPHMKRITLTGIRDALVGMHHEVHVAPAVIAGARHALERMLALSPVASGPVVAGTLVAATGPVVAR